MKRIAILLLLFTFSIGFSQDNGSDVFPRNELKFNTAMLIAGAIDFSYERLIDQDSGAGVTLFGSFDNWFSTNYAATGFYRLYFGEVPAAGFFVEGFGMVNNYYKAPTYGDYVDGNYVGITPAGTETNFAIGVGVGAKWIAKKILVIELYGGFGRNLLYAKDLYEGDKLVGRLGLTIGRRF